MSIESRKGKKRAAGTRAFAIRREKQGIEPRSNRGVKSEEGSGSPAVLSVRVALVIAMILGVMVGCDDMRPDPPDTTPAAPDTPTIAAPADLSRRTLWMEFGSTEVSACSGSIEVCSCNILAPTCTERNQTCERVPKSEHYLQKLSKRYIFDGSALKHPDEYVTRGGWHRVWKYWTYSHGGDVAVLTINQPGWWFDDGAKWVPMIDLVHRMTYRSRVGGLNPHYEGVLILQATALQESCNLRISATFELYDS